MLEIDVFTIFPNMFPNYLQESMMKRAIENELLKVNTINIRDFATDKHSMTDDTPFGGGGGMVMKPEPIFNAFESTYGEKIDHPVIFFSPQGRVLTQEIVIELFSHQRLSFLCGHYEGVDERVRENLVTDEISIGDYVLTGGELPALILIDALTRLVPGALGDPNGWQNDSHAMGLLEHPHYTRPAIFREWEVPDVLRSGNHAKIDEWRRFESIRRTFERRPEMLDKIELTKKEKKFLHELKKEQKEK